MKPPLLLIDMSFMHRGIKLPLWLYACMVQVRVFYQLTAVNICCIIDPIRNNLAALHEKIWIKKAASAQCMMWSSILIHTKCQQTMLSKRCCMTPHWKVCFHHCLAASLAGLIDLLSYNMARRCIVHRRTKMFLLYGNSE